MAELYDKPSTPPSEYGVDSDEGYPIYPAGVDRLIFHRDNFYVSNREGARIKGVAWRFDDTDPTHTIVKTILGSRLDLAKRQLFEAGRRLSHFGWLILGPEGEGLTHPAEGSGSINYCSEALYTATGNGTLIGLTFTAGSSADPAALNDTRTTAGALPMALRPGMTLRCGALSARVVDAAFTGTTTINVLVHRALDADGASGAAALVYENAAHGWPAPALEPTASELGAATMHCRHDVRVPHGIFSSFKTHHPSVPMSAGIDGDRYCAQMNNGADLSLFTTGDRCTHTGCPLYEAHVGALGADPPLPLIQEWSRFWTGRGFYLRGLIPAAEEDDFVVGRETYAGLFMLLGMQVGFYDPDPGGVYTGWKVFYADGIVRYRPGVVDADNYDIFETFKQAQDRRVAASLAESDNVGILGELADALTLSDALTGGTFDHNDADNPAAVLQNALGLRRCHRLPNAKAEGMVGVGLRGVQRVRPRRYTSPVFRPTVAGALEDGETRLTVGAGTAQQYGESAFSYDVKWELPAFGQTIAGVKDLNPETKEKADIEAMSISSGELVVDFALGSSAANVPTGVPATPGVEEIDSVTLEHNGNVVEPPASLRIWNSATNEHLGDPQRGLTPGDRIRFTAGALAGYAAICTKARYGAGAEDTGALAVDAGIFGIPPGRLATIHNRDRGWFVLEGESGYHINAAVAGGLNTYASGDFVIERAAVIPVGKTVGIRLCRLTGTKPGVDGYLPSAVDVLNAADYRFERARGIVWAKQSSWSTARQRLHYVGHVYDYVYRLTPGDANALVTAVETVREHGWVQYTLGGGANAEGWYAEKLRYIPTGVVGSLDTGLGGRQLETSIVGGSTHGGLAGADFDHDGSGDYETAEQSITFNGTLGTDPPTPSGYGYRFIFSEAGPGGDFDRARDAWAGSARFKLLSVALSTDLGRLQSSDVAEARMHVTMGASYVARDIYDGSFPENLAEPVVELVENITMQPLVFYGPDDENLILQADLAFSVGNAVAFESAVAGAYDYKATVDVTDLVKFLLDHADEITNDGYKCYVTMVDENFYAISGQLAFMNGLFESYEYDGETEASYLAVTRWLNYGNLSFGSLWINLAASIWDDAPAHHYNSALEAVAPDLKYEPA